jgi:hypothetical protein
MMADATPNLRSTLTHPLAELGPTPLANSYLTRTATTVCAYGAAAKGNTSLKVCGVGAAEIVCGFESSLAEQGKLLPGFLPGSHIPIAAPKLLGEYRADDLVVLPSNLIEDVRAQHPEPARWGGRFVTVLPNMRIFDA